MSFAWLPAMQVSFYVFTQLAASGEVITGMTSKFTISAQFASHSFRKRSTTMKSMGQDSSRSATATAS